jgi:sodium/potassium-transporting ATPase subunit alpha
MACCKKKSTESNNIAAAVDYTIRFTEHQLTLAAFAAQFGTSRVDERDPWLSRGLTSDEAAEALARDGGNALSPPKSQSDWLLFLRQFTNWFMLLLIAAGVLGLVAFFLDTSVLINLYLTLILFLVVLVTCLLSFWQERKSAHVMASFRSMLPPDASVVRDGEPRLVPAAELVVGDVVRLTPGVKVPADLRLIAVRGLRVENASLTGESQPVQCAVECTDNAPLETRNLVFNSSLVITGDALGVVVRTGDRTVIGSIAKLATRTQQAQTTLQREVSHFVRVISVGAVVMGVVFFIVGVARGQPWLSVFVNGFLTILVANVPQGLPATVTSLLSLSAARLRKRNMWIKRLDSVETLGSVSLIASDKTGTLTKNELTVVDVWVGAETVHVAGNVTEALVRQPPPFPALLSMHRVVGMCNGAQATVLEDGERRAVGNPVDVALLAAFGARGTLQLRQEAEVVYERPFNSRAKNHVVVVKTGGGGDVTAEFESADSSSSEGSADARASTAKKAHKIKQLVVVANPSHFESYVKGAPEILLAMSTHYVDRDGKRCAIDDKFRSRFASTYAMFAATGCRVIGFCMRQFDAPRAAFDAIDEDASSADDSMLHSAVPRTAYTFVGLAAMQDPPRERVADAVAACQRAGIKVFVVTGDHELTARSIAEQVGILPGRPRVQRESNNRNSIVLPDDEPTPSHDDDSDDGDRDQPAIKKIGGGGAVDDLVVVHGSRIDALSSAQWTQIFAQRGAVFARTTPQHKLRIVEEARARGFVVAVTGDGVNDAPALKAAHVGVAMGLSGTSVAREAADVALMDDDFATIVDGVHEGRVLYSNLKKTIAYTLSHLWPEVVPVLLTLAFSFPFGLSGLLVLFVDCGTELVPAISLSYEPREADVMAHAPRNIATDRLVSWSLFAYAYLIVGMAEALVCIGAWLAVFSFNNVPLAALPFSYETHWKVNATALVGNDGALINDVEQVRIANVAQSVWFMTIVLSQFWHVWFTKTRYLSIVQHPVLSNVVTNVGVLVEVGIMCIIVYVPAIQSAFNTDTVPGVYWAFSLISLGFICVHNEVRKWLHRHYPHSCVARALTW